MTVAISVVTIVYAVVLAPLWQSQELPLLCAILLHYVAPRLFVLWWLVAGARGTSRWRDIPVWMLYPIIYVAYALVRATFAGEAPYPFLDIARNGVVSVMLSALAVAALFLVVGIITVLVDGVIRRHRIGIQEQA